MFLSTLYLRNESDPEMVAVIDVFPCCSKPSEFCISRLVSIFWQYKLLLIHPIWVAIV